jgi:hypothetical protein
MDGADKLSFYEGDRIFECQAVRRADGDRHCIVAFFVVKRGFGRLDVFVAGTGPLRERIGMTEELVRVFMEDMKKTSLDSYSRAPYPVEWTHVDVQSRTSLEDQIGALQQAGVQLWTDASRMNL